ncbi:MAG: hypothetical protein HOV81_14225 [Kofleriaceae bacterium]|nr:hypothetical protein [Kofleriaceae bacterium]
MATWYGKICALLLIGLTGCILAGKVKSSSGPPAAMPPGGVCPIQGGTMMNTCP